MAGDEQRLKDARIELVLDTTAAKAKLDELEGGGDRSSAGKRPPSPGRKDARKEREAEERAEKLRPVRGGRTAAVAAAAGGKLSAVIIGAVKTIATASALTATAELLPGMIDAKLATMESTDKAKIAALEFIDAVIGEPLAVFARTVRNIQSAIPIISAFVGTAGDIARTQAALGLEVDGSAVRVGGRAAAVASANVSIAKERIRLGRFGVGRAISDQADVLRAALSSTTETNR